VHFSALGCVHRIGPPLGMAPTVDQRRRSSARDRRGTVYNDADEITGRTPPRSVRSSGSRPCADIPPPAHEVIELITLHGSAAGCAPVSITAHYATRIIARTSPSAGGPFHKLGTAA